MAYYTPDGRLAPFPGISGDDLDRFEEWDANQSDTLEDLLRNRHAKNEKEDDK